LFAEAASSENLEGFAEDGDENLPVLNGDAVTAIVESDEESLQNPQRAADRRL
jgi:hypothetical protein